MRKILQMDVKRPLGQPSDLAEYIRQFTWLFSRVGGIGRV